ncbi:cytochrome P450 [Gloeophyllum trabeum ATCC 11539]|uniref:Cytochrome P450 n=1 Tax=Gloeophyllum trabeum (strain ATCC 11539 / FP-39264 / Madison 617) TaxID=670483 RepID=S7RYU6_GLOTA|nr:cytochrome P450 [Gloeophyllum trabeum ATCC 11539]EPQ58584.1 cytochrome P450 [Gloeophyllum trabeum ATCC 11539]
MSNLSLDRSRQASFIEAPSGTKWIPFRNIFDMPKAHAWETFAKWGERWGGIMSIKLFGQTWVIINDPNIAVDILDKRGNTYADRPELPMSELSGWGRALSNSRYGPRFREYRKLIGRVIGTRGSMKKFYPAEEYQAAMFLKRVLSNPSRVDEATRKTAGAMILYITYGYKIQEDGQDPFVYMADKTMEEFSDCTTAGKYLVDLLPLLKYVPPWIPGAGFQRLAAKYRRSCENMAEVPLKFVEEQMAKGTASPSYTADLLKDPHISEERMQDIKWSALSFYGAGADTTVSVVQSYFLAMCLFPEVQKKVQCEVDSVVGRARLPNYDDREALPYVEAVCKELFRWLPIVPLAVPHRAMADDVYDGYLIPKGSWVVANVWKFLHDPDVYHNPFEFNPDRFMGALAERDPKDFVFGFGRRVCPGSHLADDSVWINIARTAAALEVNLALDESGRPVIPVPATTDGIIVRPLPFKCDIRPRHERILDLVKEATEFEDSN